MPLPRRDHNSTYRPDDQFRLVQMNVVATFPSHYERALGHPVSQLLLKLQPNSRNGQAAPGICLGTTIAGNDRQGYVGQQKSCLRLARALA